jgi:hypothetical protein
MRGTIRRRRGLAVGAIAVGVIALVVLLSRGGDEVKPGATAKAASAKQLPRGGRTLLPRTRVVAFYGAPQDNELGALGVGSPAHAARRLERVAAPYRRLGRPVLPAMELLADVAQSGPGETGLYMARQRDSVIRRYLRAARAHKQLLVLDIQPGHAGFFGEATRLEKWLREPDVSLALDPEWHTPGGVPGQIIGSVDAREVNAISFWLERLARRGDLPQKLLLVHRFTPGMIKGVVKPRRRVAVTINVDGFGTRVVKRAKFQSFAHQHVRGVFDGFKLFFKEDTRIFRPSQLKAFRPVPDVVVYE